MIGYDVEVQLQGIFMSLNHYVFANELPVFEIYDASEYMSKDELNGLYGAFYSEAGYEKYLMNYAYLKELSSVETMIHVMHHEMTHCYCHIKGIKDCINRNGATYHTLGFKAQIEAHKGRCRYVDDVLGYNETYLLNDPLQQVLDDYAIY